METTDATGFYVEPIIPEEQVHKTQLWQALFHYSY
jgi:hypothetical protein